MLVATVGCGYVGFELQSTSSDAAVAEAGQDGSIQNESTGGTEGEGGNGQVCDIGTLDHCSECDAPCTLADFPGVAELACVSFDCAIAECEVDQGDCDKDSTNGCEQALDTVEHCGACDQACELAHASSLCVDGGCAIDKCDSGHEDCNGDADDGCEATLDTDAHCGACDNACDNKQSCKDGQCVDNEPTGEGQGPSHIPQEHLERTDLGDSLFDCGVTVFDSSTLTFTNACESSVPTATVVAQDEGPEIALLPFRSFTVALGSELRLVGSRPVVLNATDTITIEGHLNASGDGSTRTPGAGGGVDCGASDGTSGQGDRNSGSGGGGGGGFGTAGGNGGNGNDLGVANRGLGGETRGDAALTILQGGCNGAPGGGCGNTRGVPGGAVQVSTTGHLVISGLITANGFVGDDGCGRAGGGDGGGSGGAIFLESDLLSLSGTLQAVGGNGGNGQNGATGGTSSGAEGSSSGSGGGGGGGGGLGRIFVRASQCDISGTTAPNPLRECL